MRHGESVTNAGAPQLDISWIDIGFIIEDFLQATFDSTWHVPVQY
jgi:hypothetical protein